MNSIHSRNIPLYDFRSSLIDDVELDICLVDSDGGVDRQREDEFFPPVRENLDEPHEFLRPCWPSEDFCKQFLPDSRSGVVKR